MCLIVNGRTCAVPEPPTLLTLLRLLSPSAPFAVARNAELVPRGAYEDCRIEPGDTIDIIHPSAGG